MGGYPVYPLDLNPAELRAITRLEDTADYLIERLRGVQPEGPYLLGGFCRMGVLAFEIAQQLFARGQEVALLVLFDAPPIFLPNQPELVRRSSKELGKLVALLRRWVGGDPAVRFGDMLRKLKHRTDGLINGLPLPAIQMIRGEISTDLLLKQAVDRYRPRTYPGPIKLVRPLKGVISPEWNAATSECWGSLAGGGLEIWDAPGDHVSMFEKPHIQVLATRLLAQLEELRAVCAGASASRAGR
jgi:thioesterase domain-containing protein